MKLLNTDYDYFVTIEIWRMKRANDSSFMYRFCYANDSPFWKNMDISLEEKTKLENNWKFFQKFVAISNVYYPSLGRGYFPVGISNNIKYPYESTHLFGFPRRRFFPFKGATIDVSLNFTVALYAFPNMKILYIGSLNQYSIDCIRETFVWTKELEATGEKSKYTFLPSEANSNVPWYEVYSSPYKNNIFYVFGESIPNPYWKINSEGIILPSNDSNDFNSIYDVLKEIQKNSLKNPDVIVQTNSKPIQDIIDKDKHTGILHNKEYSGIVFVLFLFTLISLFLVQLLFEKKN